MKTMREKHIREWVAVAPTLFGAASDWIKELLEEIDRLRAEAVTKERLVLSLLAERAYNPEGPEWDDLLEFAERFGLGVPEEHDDDTIDDWLIQKKAVHLYCGTIPYKRRLE